MMEIPTERPDLGNGRHVCCVEHLRQQTTLVGHDLLQQLDAVERASGPKSAQDPFNFRTAYKDDEQLSELRKRRKGRSVEQYHRRQNNVCILLSSQYCTLTGTRHSSSMTSSSRWRTTRTTPGQRKSSPACRYGAPAAFLDRRSSAAAANLISRCVQVKIAVWSSLLSNLILCVLQSECARRPTRSDGSSITSDATQCMPRSRRCRYLS